MILNVLPGKEGILGREILEPGKRAYQREIWGIVAENSITHVEMISVGMEHIAESQRHKHKKGKVKHSLLLEQFRIPYKPADVYPRSRRIFICRLTFRLHIPHDREDTVKQYKCHSCRHRAKLCTTQRIG